MMGTTASKLISMQQAVSEHVPSGSMVLMGAQLEQMIPFAAGHEIIRQGRRDLTLVGPISDILFDQMIGAGCASRVMAAWVGNASAGVGMAFEDSPLTPAGRLSGRIAGVASRATARSMAFSSSRMFPGQS